MRDRIHSYGLLLILTVATLEPMFRDPPSDGFPFSNYPMFSERKDPLVWVNQAVAVAGDQRVILPPVLIANEEVMQAAATLRRTFDRGREATEALCRQIADRVAASDKAELRGARRVELISSQIHAVDYFSGSAEPKQTLVRARCELPR